MILVEIVEIVETFIIIHAQMVRVQTKEGKMSKIVFVFQASEI